MNTRGHPESLVASQPGNLNAVKQGVHSPRLIQARAAEVAAELTRSFEFSPAERIAVDEAARCIAVLEAIDRDLDQRGLVDKKGAPRYLLNHRSRTSRQLEQWQEKITAAIERKAASDPPPVRADFPDYVRALQRIALGHDPNASARDRLAAFKGYSSSGRGPPRAISSDPNSPSWQRVGTQSVRPTIAGARAARARTRSRRLARRTQATDICSSWPPSGRATRRPMSLQAYPLRRRLRPVENVVVECVLEDRWVDQPGDVLSVFKPVASITACIPPPASTASAATRSFLLH